METAALRDLGMDLFGARDLLQALGVFGEMVRRVPADHRARMMAARCYVELGERERAVLALHACAEGLLHRDFLLSAMAACKLALDLNPSEKLVRETLRKIHARAVSTAPGRAPVAPLNPPDSLGDAVVVEDLMTLSGSELSEKALEVLMTPDAGITVDPNTRPPLPLFAGLTSGALLDLVLGMQLVTLPAGSEVSHEGEGGDALFVIVAGQAEVRRTIQGEVKRLGILPGGSMFGDVALLTGTLPSATVVTTVDTDLFTIRREVLAQVSQAHPELPATLADFAQHRMARNLLASAPFFAPLPKEERVQLLKNFEFKSLVEGTVVLEEGEHSDGLYLVLAGELIVKKDDPSGGQVTLGALHEGEVAGEISLLTGLRATATVTASRKTAAAFLPRAEFQRLMQTYPATRGYLESLSSQRLKEIGEALRPPEILDADDVMSVDGT